ncbi:MAG: cation diffusion facilitator family transporter [Alphaproteobacteria bacterium]|jgi:ferrous-iron efflux pump FieF|nr:cation diffusion facilitator family transporter [Rhodospirillaceae bacterium]MDG2482784.1 cation diffusion facilitator family transporter [Alphaproteobacteria bacterium]MBT6202335.1 cation diffusion facilitator family transporter [Rhodospirillaceae bacterium]MBT6512534.1 cation diffusion facilitator family transporter [Rhodospirillaceae bacterium]MBT7613473.1 cation diffusion facilitator family transporter [Rhodospirillaceae bacterium]
MTQSPDIKNGGVGRVDAAGARLMRIATIASVCVALILIIAKIGAAMMTGSVSLLSSLVDSLLDAFTSLINLLAVRHALQPADAEHRFGHGKAEPLAGLVQAAFIAGSGVFIVFEAIRRLNTGHEIDNGEIGIGVMLFSLLLTLGLVLFQNLVVKRTQSTAISADALHYRMDIMLNVGVIIALVGASQFGLWWLDGVVAIAIAFYIAFSSWSVAMRSFDLLMDREFPKDERDRIKTIVWSHPDTRGLHDLRTRSSGIQPFIQLHLELEPDLSLLQAHDIADEVELLIMNDFPGAEVIIHQDPVGHEEPHSPVPSTS